MRKIRQMACLLAASLAAHSAVADPLLATYVQTGSKLDITFAAGPTATWYVS